MRDEIHIFIEDAFTTFFAAIFVSEVRLRKMLDAGPVVETATFRVARVPTLNPDAVNAALAEWSTNVLGVAPSPEFHFWGRFFFE